MGMRKHAESWAAAPGLTSALCVLFQGTPELFSIWHPLKREPEYKCSLANGTLRCLGLCHSVPACCIQSHPHRWDPAPRQIDLRLASLCPGSHGSGNRSRQVPEARLSPSTSHSPNTALLSRLSWPDLELPLENKVVLAPNYLPIKGRSAHFAAGIESQ